MLSLPFSWFTDGCDQLRLSYIPEECALWLRGIPAASIQGKDPWDPSEPGQIGPEMTVKPASFWCAAGGGQGTGWRLRQVAWEAGGELF